MDRVTLKEEEDIFYSPERIIMEENKKNHELINSCECSDEEREKLSHMRAIVQKQDPVCKETDDLTLRRFLRARDLDFLKASTMFMKYITWRQTFVPKGFISDSEVRNQMAHNKVFIQGNDKKGRPISVVFGAKHFACRPGGADEFKRFVVFALDKLCSRIHNGDEKFTIIGDLKGYGYANSDVRGYIAALSILQDYYPERLGKLFIIHAPYIFMTAWKIIYPFIDRKTREKMIFVENKKLEATLLEDIDESQLPEIYGGKLQLVPLQDD